MSNKHAQYGKKGRKERIPYAMKKFNMDEVVTNDIRYWNKSSGFNNVTSFLWDLMIGYPREIKSALTIPNYVTELEGVSGTELNPAQIMAVDLVMGPGYASNVKDGVNRSLAQIMAKIRATLSTSNIGFETADLGIFLTSTASITNAIGYAKKVLESYTVWKDRNFAWPVALIKTLGFDYAEIRDHINEYTARLNASIDMYNNIEIPDFSDVYDRQYTMMHNIYADEDSEFAQLYVFRPKNFYRYNDEAVPANAKSENINWVEGDGDGKVTFANFSAFLDYIDNLINAWYGSSDLYQINGVLKRAFKDVPRQQVPQFEMGTKTEPHVDREHLMQIMNATILPVDKHSLNVSQDPNTQNYVLWEPYVTDASFNGYKGAPTSHVLRLFENDISNDDNMELTRLLNFATDEGNHIYSLKGCGSEIVTQIVAYTWDAVNSSLSREVLRSNTLTLMENGNDTQLLDIVAAFSPFRYIPCVYLTKVYGDANNFAFLGILGDLYNWMVYTKKDWDMLQFVAYQSLWTPKNL